MLTKELLEKYKLSNPRKYEEKLKRGEFDAVLGIVCGKEIPPVNPLIIIKPKQPKSRVCRKKTSKGVR